MRVRWLHQNLVTGHEAGNARATFALAALVEAGIDVDVIAADHTYLGRPIAGPPETIEGRLRILRVPVGSGSKARLYARFAAAALRAGARLPRPDVVLTSSPPLPGVLPGLGLARTLGVPALLEIRDLWPAFLVEGGLLAPGRAVRALEALELAAMGAASAILSVSPGFVPYLEALRPDAPVHVSITGCDPALRVSAEDPLPPALAGLEGLADDAPLVVYTGSLNEAYGIPLLLELARRRDDLRFVIAGAGRGEGQVRAAAEALDHVHFLGSLPRREVPHLLARAAVGVNLHAPWPLLGTTITGKLCDYLACGVPVLDLAGGCMRHLVERARAGEHAPRELEAASAALDRVLADGGAGERGRAFGLRHLDAPTEARRIVTLLRQTAQAERVRIRPAIGAVRRRDPARALREAYGDDPRAVAEARMSAWLDARPPTESPRPLPMPRALGGTGTTD